MPPPDAAITRRSFLRLAALAGVGCAPASLLLGRRARAAAPARQPLWVTFQALGGYDVTLSVDPKGGAPTNRGYAPADARQFGNIVVAPQSAGVVNFFASRYRQALVLNGVDTGTNDHGSGSRGSLTGTLDAGYPTTPALVAAAYGADLPAALLATGGDTPTDDLIGVTPLADGLVNALGLPLDGGGVHRPSTWDTLQALIDARLTRRRDAAVAPLRAARLTLLQRALAGAGGLSQITATMSALATAVPAQRPDWPAGLATDPGLATAAQVALAGYLHGQTAAVQIAVNGFDTHGDNDAGQTACHDTLFAAVDYLLRCAEQLQLADSVVVALASDFARTPYYNAQAGKDHWPTTSHVLVSPAASPPFPTNCTLGVTDAGQNPLPLDPVTLRPAAGGVTVSIGHVHDAMRRLLGIDASPLVQPYPLRVAQHLPLLG